MRWSQLMMPGFARHHSFKEPLLKPEINFAGLARQASPFLLRRQKKGAKEKATPIRHLCEIPCVARLMRATAQLALAVYHRPELEQCSSKAPAPA